MISLTVTVCCGGESVADGLMVWVLFITFLFFV